MIENTPSKKEQLKDLLNNQTTNPQIIVGIIILTIGLLALASTIANWSERSGLGKSLSMLMSMLMITVAIYCFKGKLINAAQITQNLVIIKSIDTLITMIFIPHFNDDDYLGMVFIGILFLVIYVGLHFYIKSKIDKSEYNKAKKLNFIWF